MIFMVKMALINRTANRQTYGGIEWDYRRVLMPTVRSESLWKNYTMEQQKSSQSARMLSVLSVEALVQRMAK